MKAEFFWQVQSVSESTQLRNQNWLIAYGADEPAWSHYSPVQQIANFVTSLVYKESNA